jgi:hypothetical protein
MARGVSADKEDVHNAIRNVDKGLYPQAFCKIIPDYLGGDDEYCNIMHAGARPPPLGFWRRRFFGAMRRSSARVAAVWHGSTFGYIIDANYLCSTGHSLPPVLLVVETRHASAAKSRLDAVTTTRATRKLL